MSRSNSRKNVGTGRGIEIAGRLVGKQDLRHIDEGAGNGHALLLTAGQFVGVMVGSISQAQQIEHGHGSLPAFPGAEAGIDQRQLDVLQGAVALQKVEALEDEAEPAIAELSEPFARQTGNILTVELVSAAGRMIETAENVHQGRLARSARPANGDEFSGQDPERYAAQCVHFHRSGVVDFVHVVELNHGGSPLAA